MDDNHVTPILCYNETTGQAEPARVDPVTGALLVYGVKDTLGTPSAVTVFDRDGNHVPVKGAYNETTGLVEAVRCTANNYLVMVEA